MKVISLFFFLSTFLLTIFSNSSQATSINSILKAGYNSVEINLLNSSKELVRRSGYQKENKMGPVFLNEPKDYVSWDAASNYCSNMGARLPTKEELKQIGSHYLVNGDDAYSEVFEMDRLLDYGDNIGDWRFFWSSTAEDKDVYAVLDGSNGTLGERKVETNLGSVRCVFYKTILYKIVPSRN